MVEFFERYSYIIIAAVVLCVALFTYLTISAYVKSVRKTMYSYKNASSLGGSIFMVILLVFTFANLFTNSDHFNPALFFFANISRITGLFPLFALPLILIFFLFMGISNISLMRHEGKTIYNTLGSILGFALIAATILGLFGWDVIYNKIIFELYTKGYRWITIFDIATQQFLTSLLCYLECLLLGAIISSLRAAKYVPSYDKDYVIILGCAIAKDGTPRPLLRGRIDRAIEFAKAQFEATGKKMKFVPSGGQGADECISEAESMKNYLLSQGIDESDIIPENKSVNTLENMRFSKALIEADGNGDHIIFSTTNYHVFRSGIYANTVGLNASGIGSKTKWYFWPNAFAREFVAMLSSNIKAHVFNAIILLLLAFLSGYATYLYV